MLSQVYESSKFPMNWLKIKLKMLDVVMWPTLMYGAEPDNSDWKHLRCDV